MTGLVLGSTAPVLPRAARPLATGVGLLAISGLGLLMGWQLASHPDSSPKPTPVTTAATAASPSRAPSASSVLDGGYASAAPFSFARSAPLRAQFHAQSEQVAAPGGPTETLAPAVADATPAIRTEVPGDGEKVTVVRRTQKTAMRASTTMRPDARAALDRLLGPAEPEATGPVLAYADPRDGARPSSPNLTGVAPDHAETTAIYDITGHTVHLPDGSKLEAHSGRYEMMDNPKYTHVRMRGPTPPGLYSLKLREQLFHGVRAIRLTPVDAKMFGRDDMLAHTYMLGARGDSSGCVVFKNYDAFLRAFLKGGITHIQIVARYEDAVNKKVAQAETRAP